MKAKKVVIRGHGEIGDNLTIEEYEVEGPKAGELGVEMVLSPVHPSDLGIIGGTYGSLPELPVVGGREGMGKVYSVGEGVSETWIGRRVYLLRETWQGYVNVPETDVIKVPEGVSDEMGSMAVINPATAWLLLNNIVNLKPGDCVVQNAGNSAVGMLVVQMAKHMDLKTMSIVRNPKWVTVLKGMGGDEVFLEGNEWWKGIKQKAKLALNSVGGESAMNLIRGLGNGGTHVTFGGMIGDAVRFPTRQLIFKDIRLRGFWLKDWWFDRSTREERDVVMEKLFKMMAEGEIKTPIDRIFSIDEAIRGIEYASRYRREGKVLINFK